MSSKNNTDIKAANGVTIKKWGTKGDVTIPGPRISVGEQLTQVLEEVRALRTLLERVLEDASTEEYSSDGGDGDDEAEELA